MNRYKRWQRYRLRCPESGERVSVLTEWQPSGGRMVMTGMSCDRVALRDLSGRDCHWKCWEGVFRQKRPAPQPADSQERG